MAGWVWMAGAAVVVAAEIGVRAQGLQYLWDNVLLHESSRSTRRVFVVIAFAATAALNWSQVAPSLSDALSSISSGLDQIARALKPPAAAPAAPATGNSDNPSGPATPTPEVIPTDWTKVTPQFTWSDWGPQKPCDDKGCVASALLTNVGGTGLGSSLAVFTFKHDQGGPAYASCQAPIAAVPRGGTVQVACLGNSNALQTALGNRCPRDATAGIGIGSGARVFLDIQGSAP